MRTPFHLYYVYYLTAYHQQFTLTFHTVLTNGCLYMLNAVNILVNASLFFITQDMDRTFRIKHMQGKSLAPPH